MKKLIFILVSIMSSITLRAQPSNDSCNGAILLTVGGSIYTGNVLGATQTLPASSTCSVLGVAISDVWYRFVSIGTTANITVTGSAGFDPVFEVFAQSCGGISLGCTNSTEIGGIESTCLAGLTPSTTYWVRVYDAGTPIPASTTFSIYVSVCSNAGIDDYVNEMSSIVISPNPATSEFTIKSTSAKINTIQLYNVLGELLLTVEANNFQATINSEGLSKGVYFVKITSTGSVTAPTGIVNKKVIIQ